MKKQNTKEKKEDDGGIACWDLSLRKFNGFCLYRLGTLHISALLDDSLRFMYFSIMGFLAFKTIIWNFVLRIECHT